MESMKLELKQILNRVKRLEVRVSEDSDLCAIVKDCSLRIALRLNNKNQMRLI